MAKFGNSSFGKSAVGKKAASFGKNKLGIDTGFGELVKLKIGTGYTTVLNPSNISHTFAVTYAKAEGASATSGGDAGGGGSTGSTGNTELGKTKAVSMGPETLGFELLLDGTGVTGTVIDVAKEIQWLSQAVFKDPLLKTKDAMEGVTIGWGTTINFVGHLETFDVTYSLFDSQGNPLRARIRLSFIGSSNLTKVDQQPKRKTNTQVVDINESDKLSIVCKSVYNSPLTYIAVAKANKLTNVRKLKPGTKLTLPPKKA